MRHFGVRWPRHASISGSVGRKAGVGRRSGRLFRRSEFRHAHKAVRPQGSAIRGLIRCPNPDEGARPVAAPRFPRAPEGRPNRRAAALWGAVPGSPTCGKSDRRGMIQGSPYVRFLRDSAHAASTENPSFQTPAIAALGVRSLSRSPATSSRSAIRPSSSRPRSAMPKASAALPVAAASASAALARRGAATAARRASRSRSRSRDSARRSPRRSGPRRRGAAGRSRSASLVPTAVSVSLHPDRPAASPQGRSDALGLQPSSGAASPTHRPAASPPATAGPMESPAAATRTESVGPRRLGFGELPASSSEITPETRGPARPHPFRGRQARVRACSRGSPPATPRRGRPR